MKKLTTTIAIAASSVYSSSIFAFTTTHGDAFYDLYNKAETFATGPLGATAAVGAIGFGLYQTVRQGNFVAGVPALIGGGAIPALFPVINSLGLTLSSVL